MRLFPVRRLAPVMLPAAAVLGLPAAASAQTFQRTFGTQLEERAEWVHQTADNGYVIAGWRGIDSGLPHIYVLKLDAAGQLQWDRQFDGIGLDVPNRVEQTPDGGYILAGETTSSGAAFLGVSLVRLDAGGALLWSYAYPGTPFAGGSHGQTGLHQVRQSDEGGFILCGRLQQVGGTQQAPVLIRTDRDGNLLWVNYYRDLIFDDATFASFNDVHEYVTPAGEAGFIACGYTAQGVNGSRDSLLVATDAAGNVVWAKVYGDSDHTDFALGLDPAANGDILMSGFAKALGEGGGTYLLRADPFGHLLWYRTFRVFSPTNSMLETPAGDIILAGNADGAAGTSYAALLKTDAGGAFQWCMAYGGALQQFGECVVPTTDGGYKLAAWTNSFGVGNFDVYSIKTDANGRSGCNEFPVELPLGEDELERDAKIVALPLEGWEVLGLERIAPETVERVLCEDRCVCPGDLNGDCAVDVSDLGILLGNFGDPGPNSPGDVDGDGDTDISDLGILLGNFGTVCP